MVIGQRLRELRESKKLSQGDIEKRTGLLRCYTSRVENGHTVPSVETLEKYARALEVPLYQIFFDSENGEAKELKLPKRAGAKISKKDASLGARLSQLVSHMDARDKKLLVGFAQKLARR